MTNIVNLQGDKRWRAVCEYDSPNGPITTVHFFEEVVDLHQIIEHGPDWNRLIQCTLTSTDPTAEKTKPARKRPGTNEGENWDRRADDRQELRFSLAALACQS